MIFQAAEKDLRTRVYSVLWWTSRRIFFMQSTKKYTTPLEIYFQNYNPYLVSWKMVYISTAVSEMV